MLLRPHVLTIGAHHLHGHGLRVRHAATLLTGYDVAVRSLAVTTAHPTIILLDLHAEEPGFPEFAAPQLAAVLTHRMHHGNLHPAWLIGLAIDPTNDLAMEAQVAGCQIILPAPITDEQRQGLLRLGDTPALLPPADRATAAYQRAAERVIRAVQTAQLPIWTADEVRLLLGYLTRYPVPRDRDARPRDLAGAQRVVRALGGLDAASQRLHAIADAWRSPAPLDAEILWHFLDGAERLEIVSSFVSRQLYEDSRVYTCIRRLPERIAQELRLAQVREES